LKGGGQLAAKAGNGEQMWPRGNVGAVRMDTSACRCRRDIL
jgi:hypothetical protein